jgi:hypothetical protein
MPGGGSTHEGQVRAPLARFVLKLHCLWPGGIWLWVYRRLTK